MRFAYEKIITMRDMEAIQRASNDLAMPENFNQKAFNTLYEGSVEIINKIFYHQLFNRKTGSLNSNLPDADRKTLEHIFSYFILKQKNDFTIYDFFDYYFQDDVEGASVKVEKYSPDGLFEMLGLTLRTLIESMDFYQYVIHNEPRFLLESDPDYFVTHDEFKKWEREQTNDSRINRNISEVKGRTTMNALNNLNNRISILKDIKVDEKTIIYTSKKEGHKLQAIDFKSAKLVNKKYNPDGIATIEMKYIEKNVKELTKALKEIENSQNFYSDTYGKYAVQVENPISGVVIPPTDTPKTWWLKEVTKANENILEFDDNAQEWTIKARSKTILSSFGNVSNSKSPKILTFYLYWERDSVTLEVDKQAIVLPTDKSIPIISMLRFDKIHENDKLTLKYTLPNDNGEVRIYSSHVSLSVNSNYSANNGDPAIQQNSEDIELLQEQIMDLRKNLASTEDSIWLSIDGDLFTDGTKKRALNYNIEKHTNKKSLEARETSGSQIYTNFIVKKNSLFSFHDKHKIHFDRYQPEVGKKFKNIFQLREKNSDGVYEPIPDQEGSKTYVEVIIKPKEFQRKFTIDFWLWHEITGLDVENNEHREFQIYNWQEDVDSRGYYTDFNGYGIATLKGTQAIGVTEADKDYVNEQDNKRVLALIDVEDNNTIINKFSSVDFQVNEDKTIGIVVDATGIKKKYVDDQDKKTLKSAKEYADEKDTATLKSANEYTDKVDESTLKLVDSETSYPEWNNIKTQDKVNQIVYKLDTTDDPVPPKPEHFLDLPICSNKEYEGEYMDVCTFSNNTGEDVYILPFGAIANITTLGNVEFGQDKIPFTLGVVLGGQGETIDSGEAEMGLQRNIAGLGVVPVIIGIANIETDSGNDMYLLKKDFKISLKLELMAYIRMYDHGTMILKDVKMPFLKKGEYDEWINQK